MRALALKMGSVPAKVWLMMTKREREGEREREWERERERGH